LGIYEGGTNEREKRGEISALCAGGGKKKGATGEREETISISKNPKLISESERK